MKKNSLWGRVALFTAALIWGSSFLVMKNTVDDVPPCLLLSIRFSLGFLLLSVIFWKKWKHVPVKTLIHGIVIGFVLGSAYMVQTFGLAETTPGKNAFLTAVYCVLVPFVDWMLYHRRPGSWNWIAAVLCLTGIGLVSLTNGFSIEIGDSLTLISGILYAVHVTLLSQFGRDDDPVLITMLQFGVSALMCWIGSWLTGSLPPVIQPGAWPSLLYLAVFATAIAILLQSVGQSMTPAAPAAILLSLESVFGVAFSVVFGTEVLSLRVLSGFVLIFIAVIASETGFSFLKRNP